MSDLNEYLKDEIIGVSEEDATRLVDLRSFPVKNVMNILLKDKTTGKNIIWATDAYTPYGKNCSDTSQITEEAFTKGNPVILRPRIEKALEQQQERTRKKAEVFTPVWLCNRMNNYCDEQWFGRKDVFNHENDDNTWTVTEGKIQFPEGKTWQEYVDSRRLEITCGEAPYLVSRYDAATGEFIEPTIRRIGILDRKLRIVNENAETEEEWVKWAERAYQSCYGYEWQGDSLLIARINLLASYCDYYRERWAHDPDLETMKHLANVIAWNIWQMDGLKDTVPFGKPYQEHRQATLFDSFDFKPTPQEGVALPCKINNWRSNESLQFKKCKSRGKMSKKLFDFVIGNPPYQEINDKNGRQPPVYHLFMDASFELGNVVELITPARFLFNAGQTPSEWNSKMLSDPHFKVLKYERDASIVFPNTDIKGGVAITYRDANSVFGAIGTYTQYPELNEIITKVKTLEGTKAFFDTLVSSQGINRFSELLMKEHPEVSAKTGSGTGNKIVSIIVEQLPDIFLESAPLGENSIKMLSKSKSGRIYRYVLRKYLQDNPYIDTYNVIIPESNGIGAFEPFSTPLILGPGATVTDTFLSIGTMTSEQEANAILSYLKTKFLRVMLGVRKVTQHNPKSTWIYVPMQDFTSSSDINWASPIPEIDKQLYAKYGLSVEEIQFIESHVPEMK